MLVSKYFLTCRVLATVSWSEPGVSRWSRRGWQWPGLWGTTWRGCWEPGDLAAVTVGRSSRWHRDGGDQGCAPAAEMRGSGAEMLRGGDWELRRGVSSGHHWTPPPSPSSQTTSSWTRWGPPWHHWDMSAVECCERTEIVWTFLAVNETWCWDHVEMLLLSVVTWDQYLGVSCSWSWATLSRLFCVAHVRGGASEEIINRHIFRNIFLPWVTWDLRQTCSSSVDSVTFWNIFYFSF